MSGIILIGGFIEVEELCVSQSLNVYGYIDHAKRDGLKATYLGSDDQAHDIFERYEASMLFITPEKPQVRKKLVTQYADYNRAYATLIDSSCVISPSVEIGEGSLVQMGVIISSESRIGRHVKVNSAACITHDVVIEDFATISPRAVICGYSRIGEGAYIGANSVILGGLSIGKNAVIGAGAVVTKDVPDDVTVVGNPATMKESSG
jgi:sugar O-acyltransferase (sialic acid O-acetyltransferase NeuD family)